MVVNNTNNTNSSCSSIEESVVNDDPSVTNSPTITDLPPPSSPSAAAAAAHDVQPPQQHPHHVYDVVIVGAGLAGLATAVGLYERGVTNIVVIEKATQFHKVGASIALFQNGIRALEYISPSISKRVKSSCIPITELLVKDGITGNVVEKKDMKKNNGSNVNYMVWYLLQQYLRDGLPSHVIQLNQKVNSFKINDNNTMNHDDDDDDNNNGNVTIHIEDGSGGDNGDNNNTNTIIIHSKVLIGCDGINSMIRNHLFGMDNSNNNGVPRKIYHGKVSYRCVFPIESLLIGKKKKKKQTHKKNDYNNNDINKSDDDNNNDDDDSEVDDNINNNSNNNKYCIEIPPEGVNTTYQNHEKGKSFSFRITAPGIMTVTSMAPIQDPTLDYNLNYYKNDIFSTASDTETSTCNKKKKQQRLKEMFQNFTAPEIQSIINHIGSSSSSSSDVRIDPIYDLDILDDKYGGWSRGGPVICIGDAVHAMSPSLGQGANQSFEDACIVVSKLSPVLLEFQKQRQQQRQQQLLLLQNTLTEVWKLRIDRVKKIHSASRIRSFANNHTHTNSTSTTATTDGTNKGKTTIDLTSNELQKLLLEINNWYPPSPSPSPSILPAVQM